MRLRTQATSMALVFLLSLSAATLPAAADVGKSVGGQSLSACASDAVKIDTLAGYGMGLARVFFDQIVLRGVHPRCITGVTLSAVPTNGKKMSLASGLSFQNMRKVGSVYKVRLDLAFDMYMAQYPHTNKPNCVPTTTRSLQLHVHLA